MNKINYWAVIVAALAAFVVSSLYYSPFLMGNIWRTVDPATAAGYSPSVGRVVVEIARTLLIVYVLALVLARFGTDSPARAVGVAVLLWFGFSALMWVGAVMWERTPWQVAAIHSGDWLLKSALTSLILSTWRRPRVRRAAPSQGGVH
jgi:hypothetical protein